LGNVVVNVRGPQAASKLNRAVFADCDMRSYGAPEGFCTAGSHTRDVILGLVPRI
jgi:hypothetical protein